MLTTLQEGIAVLAVGVLIVYAGVVLGAVVSALAWKDGRPE